MAVATLFVVVRLFDSQIVVSPCVRFKGKG